MIYFLGFLNFGFDHVIPGRAFKVKAEKVKVKVCVGMSFHDRMYGGQK
jgi:hypothetical protein